MELIYRSKKDILEIYKDGERYILKYPTFNITMPEVEKEVPKRAVDSYLAGNHTGEELIFYANTGAWKSKVSDDDAARDFLRKFPRNIIIDIEGNRKFFSNDEFEELLKKAQDSSDGKE